MNLAGSFSADGVSSVTRINPGESVTASLVCENADTFIGTVAIQVSTNGTTWAPAKSTTGLPQVFTGTTLSPLSGTITDVVIRNDGTKVQRMRVRVVDFDDDALVYAVTHVEGETVGQPLLTAPNGAPLIFRRDDGGLEVTGPLYLPEGLSGDTLQVAGIEEKVITVEIGPADIVGTGAGQLGHANGVPLVAAPGADKAHELVSVVMVNDRDTAAYTDGGNVSINWSGGGAAITGVVSAANSLGSAGDTRTLFVPLAAAATALVANAGLNLVAASAFTQPGTAAGVLRLTVRYRVHTLGLA